MNAENIKDYWPLLEALREGKTLQLRHGEVGDCEWSDITETKFSFPPDRYRAKPEPDPYQEFRDALARGELVECCDPGTAEWRPLLCIHPEQAQNISFPAPPECYRIHDPYRELKEAQAAGKVIQCNHTEFGWRNVTPDWTAPPEAYRIKPEAPKMWYRIVDSRKLSLDEVKALLQIKENGVYSVMQYQTRDDVLKAQEFAPGHFLTL